MAANPGSIASQAPEVRIVSPPSERTTFLSLYQLGTAPFIGSLADGTHATNEEAVAAESQRLLAEPDDVRVVAILARQDAVARIGNLTMIHYGVNRSLQNHAFDAKRKAFFEHSNLQINRAQMTLTDWNESRIDERGAMLLEAALRIWSRPTASA